MNESARPIRLDRLAIAVGVDRLRAWRWHRDGLIRGFNAGVGSGRGVTLTRAEAREAAALLLLARVLPPKRAKRLLRDALRDGVNALALGVSADGVTVLADGQAPNAPLVARGGQLPLFVQLDVRRLRAEIDALLDRMERETRAR